MQGQPTGQCSLLPVLLHQGLGEVLETLNLVQTFTTSVPVPHGAWWRDLPAQPRLATTPQAWCTLPACMGSSLNKDTFTLHYMSLSTQGPAPEAGQSPVPAQTGGEKEEGKEGRREGWMDG